MPDIGRRKFVAGSAVVTAAAAAELGIHTTLVPETYTVDGLVKAIVKHFTPQTDARRVG